MFFEQRLIGRLTPFNNLKYILRTSVLYDEYLELKILLLCRTIDVCRS